jgi:hypothetical protein
MNLGELASEVMKLNPEERAALEEKLNLSLDAPSESENLQLWVTEARRRLLELRWKTATDVSAEEVFRRARASIS